MADTDSVKTDLSGLSVDSLGLGILTTVSADTDSVAVPVNGVVPPGLSLAAADTDSVAIFNPLDRLPGLVKYLTPVTRDTLPGLAKYFDSSYIARDSSLAGMNDVNADTFYAPLVEKYLRGLVRKDPPIARLFERRKRPLSPKLNTSYWKHETELDSTGQGYRSKEKAGAIDVRYPILVGEEYYKAQRLREDLDISFRQIVSQRDSRRQQSRRGLGLNIVVPGGRESAFTTIFGKPEVDIRVRGQVDIDTGFAYEEDDRNVSVSGSKGRLDPDFGQAIKLGITGTIGDKLELGIDWDTERTFDFQNRLKLEYTGYEDEIIQGIVAGNVLLQTPSTLIKSGQSLFGIRTDFQLGGVKFTSVVSQEEGQGQELSVSGGAQKSEFAIRPTDYEDNLYFFLGYYFRNRWEPALNTAPERGVIVEIDPITDIEVWKLNRRRTEQDNERRIIALAGLGETLGDNCTLDINNANSPTEGADCFDDSFLDELRDGNSAVDDLLAARGISTSEFEEGEFVLLEEGRDYEFDEALGYLSLRTRLSENDALAVSYRYRDGSNRVNEIGDFAANSSGADGQINSNRLVLKLLRRANQITTDPTWLLTMRNIYKIAGGRIDEENFEIDIFYERPGQLATKSLPRDDVSSRESLLQMLGLDQLRSDGTRQSDNRIDFATYGIRPESNLLIFPYLEPFGSRIADFTDNQDFIFTQLYTEKKTTAVRDTEHDIYRIRGESQGAVQSVYNLGAFGVVQGSVVVTANGSPLTEGSDFSVDYGTGTVTIINDAYLSAGRDIRIGYERSQVTAIQKKTLLGLRADYNFLDKIKLGSTLMRLSERPISDKPRLGEEPLSNVIWGVDGSVNFRPRWLTRAIDAIPFLQTREESQIDFKGEFAQLRPGHPNSSAYRRTQQNLENNGLSFSPDEEKGISFIDTFEAIRISTPLAQANAWRLSSAPDSIGVVDRGGIQLASDSVRTNWRAGLAWYTAERGRNAQERIARDVAFNTSNYPAIRPIFPTEVFPGKQLLPEEEGQPISTFDIFFDPRDRGPYNYTTDFNDFVSSPEETWGGIVTTLPEGYTDFELNNVEFIEMIMAVHPSDLARLESDDAKLFIDLGSISEDIIPNDKLNTEDGLVLENIASIERDEWSRFPTGIQNDIMEVDQTTGRTEDQGLDGFPSSTQYADYGITEETAFPEFAQAVEDARNTGLITETQYNRIKQDISGDDYFRFNDDSYYNDTRFYTTEEQGYFQRRFLRQFAAYELNSFEANREIRGNTSLPGNTPSPDTEDVNGDATLDSDDRYFQYEIPLRISDLDRLSDEEEDVVIQRIDGQNRLGETSQWYLIRIPVKEPHRSVGGISSFQEMRSIRMWTTGHSAPITLRVAKFDLVGSQWQKSFTVGDTPTVGENVTVSTVNSEENQNAYKIPPTAVIDEIRSGTTGTAKNAKEQALVMTVKDAIEGSEYAIFKPFNQGIDLLKYSNARMFLHGHDIDRTLKDDGDVRIFIRFGLNQDQDYYEYEQPIVLSDPQGESSEVWQSSLDGSNGGFIDLNSMNIELSEFNKLKAVRDDSVSLGRHIPDIIFPIDPSSQAYEFAPPGTRLRIKGNPSLSGVTTITMGIRTSSAYQNLEVWFNELRVSGYDEENGNAALATASIKLADLGKIDANFQFRNEGFGELSSGLGDRENVNQKNWSINTSLNLHKFLPERYGWNIPISYTLRNGLSRPRYAPDKGDIRLQELLDAAPDQDKKEKILRTAETVSFDRSIRIPLSKKGSKNAIVRNTIDATQISFAHQKSESSSPNTEINDGRNWTANISYRLATRKPRTFRPLWFMDDVPYASFLGGLRMSYVPDNITAGASANRSFKQTRDRSVLVLKEDYTPSDSLLFAFENVDRYPLRETHSFGHKRNLSLTHKLFNFFQVGFDADVTQSLRDIAVDTTFFVISEDFASRRYDARQNVGQLIGPNGDFAGDSTAFQYTQLNLISPGSIIRNILSSGGSAGGIRTDRAGQRYSATITPRFSQYKKLSWFKPQPISYQSQFSWQAGPIGQEDFGNSVSNNMSIRGGLKIAPVEFWKNFDFYNRLEKADKDRVDQGRIDRAKKNQEKRTRKEERNKVKEERAKIKDRRKELEKEAEEGGLSLEELAEQKSIPIEELDPESIPMPVDTTGFSIPLPKISPIAIGRRIFLALTSSRDLSFTLSQNRGGSSSNIRGGYGFFRRRDEQGRLLQNPPLRYRLGLDRIIDPTPELRLIDAAQGIVVQDRLTSGRNFSARGDLNVTPTFKIDFDWKWSVSDTDNITYRPPENGFVPRNSQRSGKENATVWIFGGNYEELFKRQFAKFDGSEVLIDDDNAKLPLTNKSLVDDFTSVYVRGLGRGGNTGFLPGPVPNWSLSYTGLGSWPILRALAQSATVRHSYTATYDSGFKTNSGAGVDPDTGERLLNQRNVGGTEIISVVDSLEISDVRLNQKFQPAIGINVSWKGGLQTDFNWNKSKSLTLGTINSDLALQSLNEKSIKITFSKRGMRLRIPGLSRRKLNNTIRFTLTLSTNVSIRERFRLESDIESRLLDPGAALSSSLQKEERLKLEPRIAYTFSNRVTAAVFVEYDRLITEGSQTPNRTKINGGFNFKIQISN